MKKNNCRRVNTGLENTDTNKTILSSVIGQMSDGIWENSNRVIGYWVFAHTEAESTDILISRQYMDDYYNVLNPYRNMTDEKVRKYFANKIKQIVKTDMEDDYYRAIRNNIYAKYSLHPYLVHLEEEELALREKAQKEYRDYVTEHPFSFRGKFTAQNEDEVDYLSSSTKIKVKDAYDAYKTLMEKTEKER